MCLDFECENHKVCFPTAKIGHPSFFDKQFSSCIFEYVFWGNNFFWLRLWANWVLTVEGVINGQDFFCLVCLQHPE